MKLGSIAVMCALAAALVLSGCSKPGVVGTWNGAAGPNLEMKIALTLSKDAKFRQASQISSMGRQNQMLATGTYTAKDGALTMMVANVTINGKSLPAPARTASTFKYKLEGDKLTLSPEKSTDTVVLTRAKE